VDATSINKKFSGGPDSIVQSKKATKAQQSSGHPSPTLPLM